MAKLAIRQESRSYMGRPSPEVITMPAVYHEYTDSDKPVLSDKVPLKVPAMVWVTGCGVASVLAGIGFLLFL